MLLPIGDENPRARTPYVNFTLLGANVVVFFLTCFPEPDDSFLARWALVPSRLDPFTFVSSMFLHANLMHLAGNMLFLWIFGDNVEDRLGHAGYAAFYLASGIAADFLHLATIPDFDPRLAEIGLSVKDIPMLGASGAISGVVGAYAVFFPRHAVRTLFFFTIIRIPAIWWVGGWFLEQVIFASQGFGGVAYWAHIGGLAAGVVIAGGARAWLTGQQPQADIPAEIREPSRSASTRKPFITIDDAPGIEFLADPGDRHAVLRLGDGLHHVGRIAEATAEVTGLEPDDIARRLEATRGVITRGIPRVPAERLQRTLQGIGIPSAVVPDNPSTQPPPPAVADSARWNSRGLRLGCGNTGVDIAWERPFLYVSATVEGAPFIDLFMSRRATFRVAAATRFVETDAEGRRENPSDLSGLARAIVAYRSGAALNDGIRVLANGGAWGWLSFGDAADYDDYVFWVYSLILSRVPLHRM